MRTIAIKKENTKKTNMSKILNQNQNTKKKTNMRKTLNQKENMIKAKMRKILNQKENMKKNKYENNPKPKTENRKKMHKKNKQCFNKVEKFFQQIRQCPYFICRVCHWCLYKCNVRLFEHEKYQIITAELYCPVRSFDEKTYISDAYHKDFFENEISGQAVFNKMSLDPIPDDLKDSKKFTKILIFKKNIF